MSFSAIDAIERQVNALPRADQLRLVERIVHRLTEADELASASGGWPERLEAMAADPDILRECAAIEREFGPTEGDGLDSR